jgi:hypothetical protein
MGAKDWMLMYADGGVRPILQVPPPPDPDAINALIARLYPGHRIVGTDDGNLFDHANPPDHYVYASCRPGLTVICTREVALDRPSELERRFLDEARGRTVYLHAMHSVVDWFAYAVWSGDGVLRRSLSLSPDSGVIENIGSPLAFEAPYWAGDRPIDLDDADADPYPLPFHPLDMAEDALRSFFGFNFEGEYRDDDPDLEAFTLSGFAVTRS